MNEFMYAQREIGDYRISVYYDDNASCPYEDFDEVGLFLYETCRSHFLAGNTESVWLSRTLEGALRDLVWKYVDLPDETSPQDLEKDELIDLLNSQEDLAFIEWTSRGYCQGDYVYGVAFCTEERFKQMVDTNMTDWRKRAIKLMRAEVKEISMWLWGDVKCFTLEKRIRFTKVYKDEESDPEDCEEWKEIERTYDIFTEDAEDVINDVIAEYGLKDS